MVDMPSFDPRPNDSMLPHADEIGPGVYCEWSYNYQIAMLTVKNSTDQAIDAWSSGTLAVVKAWPPEKPLLMLLDVSYRNNAAITRYARQQAAALTVRCKTIRRQGPGGGLALVFARTTMNHTLHQLFEGGEFVLSMPLRVFYERDIGVYWLSQLLDRYIHGDARFLRGLSS